MDGGCRRKYGVSMLPTVVPVFGQAVTEHREALSYVDAANALVAGDPAQAEAQQRLQRLTQRALAQRAELGGLAERLKAGQPVVDGLSTRTAESAAGAMELAESHLAAAQAKIKEITGQINVPLLPNVPALARMAIVFGGLGLVAWIFQCGLITVTNGTDARTLGLSLCGFPLLVFLLGVLVLQSAGQPKLGDRVKYPWKIGAVLALVLMPLAWVVFIIVLLLVR
jgi:hypothetical protein